jgi:signal transduction histidine kinase
MSGYAELVERRYPDEDTRKLVRGIREEIDALERLVSRFLSFAGNDRFERRPTELGGLLEDALRVAIPPDSAVRVERRFPPDGPVVDADSDALREVFVNLVRNAVQATGGHGSVSIAAEQNEHSVDVRVTDDGPGISEEIRSRLFQPFATTKADGTGLGLAICRRIITGHQGTLGYETGTGGTTFRVTSPCRAHLPESDGPNPPRRRQEGHA